MTELVDFIADLLTGAQVIALSLAVGGIVWGLLVLQPWRCRSDASAGVIAQLVALWRFKRRRPELEALWSVALRRFSSVAVAAVALIIASGGGLVWSYVGTWRALVGTGYGALVVTKVVLLAAALGM